MIEKTKAIVVGLDGAEKNLITQWANDGTLPSIRSLMRTGSWCTVENPAGLFAGSVWPSFYTGMSPARHGKYCSNQLKSGTYEVRRVHGFDPRCPTIWDVLNKQGKRSAIIDAPKTEASVNFNGIQVIDWSTEDFEIELRSVPAELAGEVYEKYGLNPVVELQVDVSGADSLLDLRNDLMERLETKEKLCADFLARDHWDFFFNLFTEVHTAGHLCWHLHDPDHPQFDERLVEEVGDIVRDVYVATDAVLGRLVQLADESTRVYVYSVNGMGANYTGIHLLDDILYTRERAQLTGIRHALAKGADWLDSRIPGRIYDDVYPMQRSMRRGLSLPVRDLPARSSFRVPTNGIVGGVRINLKGREPEGMIAEEDYERYCDDLDEFLSNLINVDTGQPVARRIINTHRAFDGEHVAELPDLLIEWAQDAPISRVYSPEIGTISKMHDGHRTGDHRPDGLLIITGPGQNRGQMEPVSIYDLAPTLTASLGSQFGESDGSDVSHRLGIAWTA